MVSHFLMSPWLPLLSVPAVKLTLPVPSPPPSLVSHRAMTPYRTARSSREAMSRFGEPRSKAHGSLWGVSLWLNQAASAVATPPAHHHPPMMAAPFSSALASTRNNSPRSRPTSRHTLRGLQPASFESQSSTMRTVVDAARQAPPGQALVQA